MAKIKKFLLNIVLSPNWRRNGTEPPNFEDRSIFRPSTSYPYLMVQSFAGTKFRGDKLSRTPRAKIKFRGYKLSRMGQILVNFSYFEAIFTDFASDILRSPMKVRFRGY